ncbi:MAG: DUF2812 domain-containing protein [Oscillospiraceae bacterium]|nr:DUF2812 domain-containing protein [Oscillospiraceae bacterium]
MECYKKHFFDMDKEEQWLNEMADKGMVLTKIGHGIFVQKYYFEKSDTAYTYRVDYSRDGAVMEEITAPYVMFVTSSCDAEYVCWSDGKVYFRRAKEKGDFAKLYSDPKSRYDAEQRQFGGCVGLMSLFVFDICYCGYFVITAVREGRSDWIIVFEAICILLCAVFLFLIARKAISCCRKMKELKQMMQE